MFTKKMKTNSGTAHGTAEEDAKGTQSGNDANLHPRPKLPSTNELDSSERAYQHRQELRSLNFYNKTVPSVLIIKDTGGHGTQPEKGELTKGKFKFRAPKDGIYHIAPREWISGELDPYINTPAVQAGEGSATYVGRKRPRAVPWDEWNGGVLKSLARCSCHHCQHVSKKPNFRKQMKDSCYKWDPRPDLDRFMKDVREKIGRQEFSTGDIVHSAPNVLEPSHKEHLLVHDDEMQKILEICDYFPGKKSESHSPFPRILIDLDKDRLHFNFYLQTPFYIHDAAQEIKY